MDDVVCNLQIQGFLTHLTMATTLCPDDCYNNAWGRAEQVAKLNNLYSSELSISMAMIISSYNCCPGNWQVCIDIDCML